MTFDHRDCGITLLKNDHVLINLLYNVATGRKMATNIKPKVPFTFSYTKEIRELVNIGNNLSMIVILTHWRT